MKYLTSLKIIISLLLITFFTSTPVNNVLSQDETEAKSIPIGFIEPDNALTMAKSLISSKGAVVFNQNNNTLVVVDYPKNIAKIENVLSNQKIPEQVRIEVKFKDASAQDRSVFGLAQGSRTHSVMGMQHITTISGGLASISVCEQVPDPYWFYAYGYRWGYIVTAYDWREVGTKLLVQPVVMGDIIKVSLIPEISFFDGKVGRRRTIQYRNVSTTVICQNGQSIQIGGLTQSKDRRQNEFFLQFFRTQNNQNFQIVLTPHIISSPQPAEETPKTYYFK